MPDSARYLPKELMIPLIPQVLKNKQKGPSHCVQATRPLSNSWFFETPNPLILSWSLFQSVNSTSTLDGGREWLVWDIFSCAISWEAISSKVRWQEQKTMRVNF
jgi:hypothetical protein